MTNLRRAASRPQRSSGHVSIELPISRIGAAAASPKVSAHSSTSPALMILSMTRWTAPGPGSHRSAALRRGGDGGQGLGDGRLGRRLPDAGLRQGARAVLELQEREEKVLGADVVVAEAEGFTERQFKGLLRVLVEGDEVRDLLGRGREGGGGGLADGVQQDVLGEDRLRGERVGLREQAEDEVGRG